MFRRARPLAASDPASTIDLSQPHDTCVRCGRPTPPGVSLCDRDNPGHIKSPSATQVHGTVVVGLLAGFVLLALMWRLMSAGFGPFGATVTGVATRADGGLDVVVSVTNNGNRTGGASCSVSVSGAPSPTDYVFFTDPIGPGETRQFSQTLPARAGQAPLQAGSLVVRCT
jgi:predicted nucleic acid-binding Zn ribbon protein